MIILFFFLGIILFFFKKGGILSWLFNLEILVVGFVFSCIGSSGRFFCRIIFAVLSACIVLSLFVFCLVEARIRKTWAFKF